MTAPNAAARPLVIYGGGGFAREVAWLAEQQRETGGELEPVCFIDDATHESGCLLNGLPVFALAEAAARFAGAAMVVAVGNPKTRELLSDKGREAGFEEALLVHPRVERSRFVSLGVGTVICAGNILTTNIELGRGVQLNLDCTVGHDVVMEDFATLAPGVHVSGWVTLRRGAYVGTGATIINGTKDKPLVLGANCIVGAGACVTRDVPDGATVVGVPARSKDSARA
jgi:sugar O-acyltransferase (sialic acid O-acetyltransferase NeuD family)